jgi:hypothetical protein
VLHRDVAVLVGGRAAQQDDVHGEGLEAQPLLSGDRHQLDQVVGCLSALPGTQPGADRRRCGGPSSVMSPGRPAAMSRVIWDMTPCGSV